MPAAAYPCPRRLFREGFRSYFEASSHSPGALLQVCSPELPLSPPRLKMIAKPKLTTASTAATRGSLKDCKG
jgi:hypothetical protein